MECGAYGESVPAHISPTDDSPPPKDLGRRQPGAARTAAADAEDAPAVARFVRKSPAGGACGRMTTLSPVAKLAFPRHAGRARHARHARHIPACRWKVLSTTVPR